MKMHERQSWDDLREPGEYLMAVRPDGSKFPVIVCPGCGRPMGCPGHTMVKEKPLTLVPSVLCVGEKRRICWHGWVTEGVMEAV